MCGTLVKVGSIGLQAVYEGSRSIVCNLIESLVRGSSIQKLYT